MKELKLETKKLESRDTKAGCAMNYSRMREIAMGMWMSCCGC
ncbi:MAG: hypothetical protein SVJ22_02600 [Halobacteriota archaeon]|nr:hypothetical protein [Halobacteriota archaeon]